MRYHNVSLKEQITIYQKGKFDKLIHPSIKLVAHKHE